MRPHTRYLYQPRYPLLTSDTLRLTSDRRQSKVSGEHGLEYQRGEEDAENGPASQMRRGCLLTAGAVDKVPSGLDGLLCCIGNMIL
jgi:hypothetical protein